MTAPLTIFHIDMNFVSLREDYLRSLLKRVADSGYNAILWELEDKVQWETCSEVVWPEAMSKEQFRDVLDYSRELGLQPIPLLQTVGHGEYVMKHEPYVHLREQPDRYDCYCTSNPKAQDLLRRLTQEYLDLFGELEHFHFGGDEAYVFATCPKCKAAAEEKGRNRLYAEHILKIAEPAIQAGVRPGIWSDMVMHHPEQVDAIDRRFALWDWNYWEGPGTPHEIRIWGEDKWLSREEIDDELISRIPDVLDENGDLQNFYPVNMLKRLGFDVVVCSSVRSSSDTVCCPIESVHAANVVGAAQKAAKEDLLGHCVTSWAVRIFNPDLHEMELALEPEARANPDKPLEAIKQTVGERFFGVSPDGYYEAADKLGRKFTFAMSGADKGTGIQWNHLKDSEIPPKGYALQRMRAWKAEGQYAENKQEVLDTAGPIAEGLSAMKEFAKTVTTECGKRQVEQWLIAGDLQYRMNEMAQEFFAFFEGNPTQSNAESISQIEQLKSDFCDWAKTWMTPQSAEHNARLIFDHLIEAHREAE